MHVDKNGGLCIFASEKNVHKRAEVGCCPKAANCRHCQQVLSPSLATSKLASLQVTFVTATTKTKFEPPNGLFLVLKYVQTLDLLFGGLEKQGDVNIDVFL